MHILRSFHRSCNPFEFSIFLTVHVRINVGGAEMAVDPLIYEMLIIVNFFDHAADFPDIGSSEPVHAGIHLDMNPYFLVIPAVYAAFGLIQPFQIGCSNSDAMLDCFVDMFRRDGPEYKQLLPYTVHAEFDGLIQCGNCEETEAPGGTVPGHSHTAK